MLKPDFFYNRLLVGQNWFLPVIERHHRLTTWWM